MFKGRQSEARQQHVCSTNKQTHLLLLFPKPTGSSQKSVTHPAVAQTGVLHSNCATLLQPPEAINSPLRSPIWGCTGLMGGGLICCPFKQVETFFSFLFFFLSVTIESKPGAKYSIFTFEFHLLPQVITTTLGSLWGSDSSCLLLADMSPRSR